MVGGGARSTNIPLLAELVRNPVRGGIFVDGTLNQSAAIGATIARVFFLPRPSQTPDLHQRAGRYL